MTIPSRIKASVAIAAAERYTGSLAITGLERLAGELSQRDGELLVELRAAHNYSGDWLLGTVRGALVLNCRRCLKPFPHELTIRLELRLVGSEEEEARYLQDSEPYRVEDDQLPLWDLVEDEVLLALPMMPRCESCENEVRSATVEASAEAVEKRPNPFAQLKNLKF